MFNELKESMFKQQKKSMMKMTEQIITIKYKNYKVGLKFSTIELKIISGI